MLGNSSVVYLSVPNSIILRAFMSKRLILCILTNRIYGKGMRYTTKHYAHSKPYLACCCTCKLNYFIGIYRDMTHYLLTSGTAEMLFSNEL